MSMINFNGAKFGLFALMAAVVIAACNSPKKMARTLEKMELRSEPQVLEVHGDSVLITVKGKFPPKSFAKNGIVKFQPILRYDTVQMPLKTMYIKGEKVKMENAKTISYKNGGTFTYTDKVEYTPQMKRSVMTMDYAVKLDSKYDEMDQCIPGSADTATIGSITTSLTVKPTDDIYFFSDDKPADNGKRIIFYYVINEGFLRDSVKKGPNMTAIRNIVKDTGFRFKNIILNSYASPDGEVALNASLTQQRAKSAETIVRNELKRLGIKEVYDSTFVSRPDKDEDWEGLRRVVSQSSLAGKDEVLAVINSNLSVEDKEANLRKLGSWEAMKKDILPRLRRTEVVFSGTIPNRSIESVRSMSTTNLDGLTQKELIMLANQSTDTTEKERIYKHYMTKYPNDWSGRNNYAALLLQRGQYEDAHKMFEELHNEYRDNDTIHNNLGVAKRHLRKYNEAKDLYQMAERGGLKENNNLGILYIKYGDYENSVNSFEADRCDYNVALAYTLKGDYENAKRKIECIEDKTADVYYLRAVVGARSGDKELMTTSLTRAIQMDATLRDMAKEDLEFLKYRESAEFTNAIR